MLLYLQVAGRASRAHGLAPEAPETLNPVACAGAVQPRAHLPGVPRHVLPVADAARLLVLLRQGQLAGAVRVSDCVCCASRSSACFCFCCPVSAAEGKPEQASTLHNGKPVVRGAQVLKSLITQKANKPFKTTIKSMVRMRAAPMNLGQRSSGCLLYRRAPCQDSRRGFRPSAMPRPI